VNIDFPIIDKDATFIRLIETIEDIHQGRLAGAVLTQYRVYSATVDANADVIVRRHISEDLGYPIKD
jgi:hypothetical protein